MGEAEKPPRVAPPVRAPAPPAQETRPGAKALSGAGSLSVPVVPEIVWRSLLDPAVLARTIPGCRQLDRIAPNDYRAEVSLGVGIIKGRFRARVTLSDLDPPRGATLSGGLEGPLGVSSGNGRVRLAAQGTGTQIEYDYVVEISGKAAAVGSRMLDGAAKLVINQFFQRLVAEMTGERREHAALSWWRRLLKALGF
jgi:2-furoyl-CoA dehydrogenase large subunit